MLKTVPKYRGNMPKLKKKCMNWNYDIMQRITVPHFRFKLYQKILSKMPSNLSVN